MNARLNLPAPSLDHSARQLAAFIRNNPNWSLQALIFFLCVAYEALITFYELIDNGSTPSYAIARSCGAVLKILMMSILIPLSRVAYTALQVADGGRYLDLEHRLRDHMLFGIAIPLFFSPHTLSHLIYKRDNLLKQPGITGLLMIGSFVVLGSVFALRKHIKPLRDTSYEATALTPHKVLAGLYLTAYMLHTPDYRLVKHTAVNCLPLAIDRLVETVWYRYPTVVTKARIIPNTEFMYLQLRKPDEFQQFIPGQYVLISINGVNGFFDMQHPFTLVNGQENGLELLIKRTGPWTKKLYHWISTHVGYSSAVITGPFGGPIITPHTANGLTMIGTGVGVTPTLALLNGMATHLVHANNVSIHLSQRNVHEFEPCYKALSRAHRAQPASIRDVHFYVTGKNIDRHALTSHMAATSLHRHIRFFVHAPGAETETIEHRRLRNGSTPALFSVNVHLRRPDLKQIVLDSQAVNVCGSPEVTKTVSGLAREHDKKCRKESF